MLSRLREIILGNMLRRTRKLFLGTVSTPNIKWGVEMARKVSSNFQPQPFISKCVTFGNYSLDVIGVVVLGED